MSKTTIYIEADEEITSIVDKIKASKGKQVALVAPKGAVLLQSLVNLRLLQKVTKKAGVKLDLVTTDSIGKNLALQAGFPVFKSLKDDNPSLPEDYEEAPGQEVLEADSSEKPIEDMTQEQKDLNVSYYKKDTGDEAGFATKELESRVEGGKEVAEASVLPQGVSELIEDKPSEKLSSEAVDAINDDEAIKSDSGFVAHSAGSIHSREQFEHKSVVSPPVLAGSGDDEEISTKNSNSDRPSKGLPSGGFRNIGAQKNKRRAIAVGVGISVILLVLGLAAVALPRATVSIVVNGKEYKKDLTATIVTDDTALAGQDATYMKGEILTKDISVKDEYTATGKKDVGTKASGSVTVYNGWNSSPISYVAGTKFTASGKVYTNNSAFTVPGAGIVSGNPVSGSVKVTLTASDNGDSYNLDAIKFTIASSPDNSKLYAQSTEKFTGGSTKLVTVVSKDDADNAKASEEQKAKEEALKQLKAINADLTVLDDAVVLVSTKSESSADVNEQLDTFTYTIEAKATVTAFNKQNFSDKIMAIAQSELAKDEKLVLTQEGEIPIVLEKKSEDGKTLTLKPSLVGKIIPDIALTTIASKLTFKSNDAVVSQIKQLNESFTGATISHTPSFWPRTPLLKGNIKVEYTNQ